MIRIKPYYSIIKVNDEYRFFSDPYDYVALTCTKQEEIFLAHLLRIEGINYDEKYKDFIDRLIHLTIVEKYQSNEAFERYSRQLLFFDLFDRKKNSTELFNIQNKLLTLILLFTGLVD